MSKSTLEKREMKYCTTCKKRHMITEDGFEYFDCHLEYLRLKRIRETIDKVD